MRLRPSIAQCRALNGRRRTPPALIVSPGRPRRSLATSRLVRHNQSGCRASSRHDGVLAKNVSPPIWASSHVSRLHAKRQSHHARRRPRYASFVGNPGGRRFTRYEIRLRHRAVRRLHRAHRRPGHALMHHAALGRGRPARHYDRRHRQQGGEKPFKPPGSICRFRNAAIASLARSCRRRLCSSRIRSRTTRISMTPCAATSVVARPIRASAPPSVRPLTRWRAKR
jgi:hypothetical protein